MASWLPNISPFQIKQLDKLETDVNPGWHCVNAVNATPNGTKFDMIASCETKHHIRWEIVSM